MHIGITGASGFIGRQLIQEALSREHVVTPYSRRQAAQVPGCEPVRIFGPQIDLSGLNAVIHLAGESILGLWTKRKRTKILQSRIDGTRWIIDAIARARIKPSALISASGVSIYGNRGEEILTDSSSPNTADLLAQVAMAWETEGSKAEAEGVRYV